MVTRGVASSPQGSPELWPGLEGEEVRGPTSWAVPIDGPGYRISGGCEGAFFINNFCSEADFLIKPNSFQICTFKGFDQLYREAVNIKNVSYTCIHILLVNNIFFEKNAMACVYLHRSVDM
jgi:hypothetical protein